MYECLPAAGDDRGGVELGNHRRPDNHVVGHEQLALVDGRHDCGGIVIGVGYNGMYWCAGCMSLGSDRCGQRGRIAGHGMP